MPSAGYRSMTAQQCNCSIFYSLRSFSHTSISKNIIIHVLKAVRTWYNVKVIICKMHYGKTINERPTIKYLFKNRIFYQLTDHSIISTIWTMNIISDWLTGLAHSSDLTTQGRRSRKVIDRSWPKNSFWFSWPVPVDTAFISKNTLNTRTALQQTRSRSLKL